MRTPSKSNPELWLLKCFHNIKENYVVGAWRMGNTGMIMITDWKDRYHKLEPEWTFDRFCEGFTSNGAWQEISIEQAVLIESYEKE
ncbi:MAG: hypothetical protein R3321_09990 [Nitrososphaeraceae archaeon]|nr:hypothetical protein [Nitrososphaeraceae archaeon]